MTQRRFPATMTTGGAARLVLCALVLAMAVGPALADKLVVFRNGKVLRAQSITTEGQWTYADLGKGATVGVHTTDILRIEDAAGEAKEDSGYNRASTENRGVSRGGGGGGFDRGGDRGRDRASSVQERIQQRQQELEEKRQAEAEEKGNNNRPTQGGLRGTQPVPGLNNSANRGFRRSRMPGAFGQRMATDQRVVRPTNNDGDDDN